MHHLVSNRAMILGSVPEGEANRVLVVLTEGIGLLRVHAQGVRHERSKHRYLIFDGAQVRITLVRGREFWRLVGVEEAPLPSMRHGNHPAERACRRVRSLVRRLVRGEGEGALLYATLTEGAVCLRAQTDIETLQVVELVLTARILDMLGYLRLTPSVQAYLRGPLSEEVARGIDAVSRRELTACVREALRETQL